MNTAPAPVDLPIDDGLPGGERERMEVELQQQIDYEVIEGKAS